MEFWRPLNAIYQNGNIVWYKRKNGWRGPGKVVFQDGKVIFVRHSSVLIRVSANRIIKKGEEFNQQDSKQQTSTGSSDDISQNFHKGNPEPFIQINDEDDFLEIPQADNSRMNSTQDSHVLISPQHNESVEGLETSNTIQSFLEGLEPDNTIQPDIRERSETSNTIQYSEEDSEPANSNDITTQVESNDGKRKRSVTPQLATKRLKFSPSKGEKLRFKRGDLIEFEEQGSVSRATILNREKVTGRFYNYFNVQCEDGSTRNINGGKVNPKRLELEENMVLIPTDRHKDEDCMKAKEIELNKLKDFKTHETVRDEGQHRIGTSISTRTRTKKRCIR